MFERGYQALAMIETGTMIGEELSTTYNFKVPVNGLIEERVSVTKTYKVKDKPLLPKEPVILKPVPSIS